MAKGRKPIPRSVNKLRGNPGRRRGKSGAMAFQAGLPSAPEYLRGGDLEIWRELTTELHALGIITKFDQHILAVYCQAVGELNKHTAALENESDVIVSTRGGSQLNPRVRYVKSLREEIAKYASELGLSPTSRNKLELMPKTGGEKPATEQERLAGEIFGGQKVRVGVDVYPK
jgi:P27 family predicted phage terminase small subunit